MLYCSGIPTRMPVQNCRLLLRISLRDSKFFRCPNVTKKGCGNVPKYKYTPDKDYVVWQLPTDAAKTGMSYVIGAADGRAFVIDGGRDSDAPGLCDFLRAKFGGKVSAWFLTHPHPGHAGAFCRILEEKPAGLKIAKVFFSRVDEADVLKYEPKHAEFVKKCNLLAKTCGIPAVTVHAGDRFKIGRTLIRVLSAGETLCEEHFLDNTSVVYKFTMYCTSLLFLGDIRRDASVAMLETYKNELNCDIVQMANHGLDGALSEVYVKATPVTCLWSLPQYMTRENTPEGVHFCEARRLMEALGAAEHYVSGTDGLCELHITY